MLANLLRSLPWSKHSRAVREAKRKRNRNNLAISAYASVRNLTMVKAALMVGGDPNAPQSGVAHAIEIAASMGDREMINLLLEADAYPTEGAVQAALMEGHDEVAKFLREARTEYTGAGAAIAFDSATSADKRKLVTKLLGTYGVVYIVDHGKEPSRHTISYWIQKLTAFQPVDIVRVGRSTESVKRFLESGKPKVFWSSDL